MTGFRLAFGGAQELYGIQPDLTTMGKIIGGGLPVGAYGGPAEIMDMVAPLGPMYQAGTLSGNPLAMAAGHAQLALLKENKATLSATRKVSGELVDRCGRERQRRRAYAMTYNRVGSMFTWFFTPGPVTDWDSAAKSDTEAFGTLLPQYARSAGFIYRHRSMRPHFWARRTRKKMCRKQSQPPSRLSRRSQPDFQRFCLTTDDGRLTPAPIISGTVTNS